MERFDGPAPTFASSADSTCEIRGINSARLIPENPVGDGAWVLEMEYFCTEGVESITMIAGPPFENATHRSLPAIGNSETWSPYVVRLSSMGNPFPAGWKELRIDLRVKTGGVLQLRNARLRLERLGEFDQIVPSDLHAAKPQDLEAYLNQKFDSTISRVQVDVNEIAITGHIVGENQELFIGDVPMEILLGSEKPFETLTPIVLESDGVFTARVPRSALRNGRSYDRLTSRWQVFRRDGSDFKAMTHARYPDEVACRSPQLPPAKVASKKGLGGWSPSSSPVLKDELKELAITAVTVNIMALHQFVSLVPSSKATPFLWQERTYYAHQDILERYDRIFREAEKNGAMVSAILLISNPSDTKDARISLLGHPNAVNAGKFAMPNVTSSEGLEFYGAIVNLLTERWSRDDGVHGRVHHWIIHNEVDYGWYWTNAGEISDIAYLDLYQRSMRLVHLIASQYDPNARAFISLTHHWAESGGKHGYGSKRMLELLVRFCQAEGDFPWALAYHPYPQNLFNPRTWEDKQATTDFDTPKITPKNLEVLDAYMKLPALRFHDKVRMVHLSENGFNSKDYSPKALEDQAAGMAFAWKKIAKLSSIESWQYHNWIDNRHEGGLRIGLRKFSDDPEEPVGRKPIWYLYQALGTPQEDGLAIPYLKTIGISSWDEITDRNAKQRIEKF